MKRYASFWFVLALFGCLHAYWSVSRFGFQEVDLPPAQFFMFSLWSCVRDIVTYTLLLSAPVFLFGRFAKWVVTAVWAYIVIVVCSSVYVGKVFHADLSSIWIELVTNTSVNEVIGFLKMTLGLWPVVGILLICLVIVFPLVVLKKLQPQEFSGKSVLIGVALLMPFVLINLVLMNWHWGVGQMPYTRFVISSVTSYQRNSGFRHASENQNLPKVIATPIHTNDLPSVVIVLGESSTRNNWHLYGYERHTTPRMDEICALGEAVALTDVVGISPATVGALGLFLTDVRFETLTTGHWTLAEVMRRAGYQTVVISNQADGKTSLQASLFNGCLKRISMFEEMRGKKHYDETMIPYLRAELSKSAPMAIFVHLAGMHYPVHDACPESEKHFTDGVESGVLAELSEYNRDRRNRYDDGIRYEDKVLGMIVDVLREQDRASFMFFISDHGESPRSDGWRVYTDMDVYELPCVIWMSMRYKEQFADTAHAIMACADKPLQPDQMTGGLLDLAIIERSNLNIDSFLDPNFKCRVTRKVDKGRMNYVQMRK